MEEAINFWVERLLRLIPKVQFRGLCFAEHFEEPPECVGVRNALAQTAVDFEFQIPSAGSFKRFFDLIHSRTAEVCDENPDFGSSLEQIADYVSMSLTILIGYNLHDEVLARAIILIHKP